MSRDDLSDIADKYPEHARLKNVNTESQAIGEFLDWLVNEKKIFLAEFIEDWHPSTGCALPIVVNFVSLLADYYKIDLAVIETEKRAMLKDLRESITEKEVTP